MNGQRQKGGWFLPAADDTAIKNDVKTCRIVGMRGETPRKHTTWYVTVLDGDQETEYCCRNNPFYSDEEIAAKREITIATFDDVNDEDEISMVYILDQVYPNYRNPA